MLLERRGIVENGRLTRYGRAVEAMPVERAWAECWSTPTTSSFILAVMASIESLHRMTRDDATSTG